jgi:hypothetical protein
MSVKTKEHFYTGIPIIRSKLLQGCMLSFTGQYTLVVVGQLHPALAYAAMCNEWMERITICYEQYISENYEITIKR